MEPELVKGRPLSKEETKALLELVRQSKIIINKITNATNNKLKNEEWSRIAAVFNATITAFSRTPQQLRLKWENLMKNARKRCTKIRMNNLQTGSGRGGYIPPDDILDCVSGLLGSTASGFDVPFGGDSVPLPVDSVKYINFGDGDDGGGSGDGINIEFEIDPMPSPDMLMGSGPCSEVREINAPRVNAASTIPMGSGPCSEVRTPIRSKAVLFKTPGSGKKRVRDSSKTARDDSIAEYYKLKKNW